jgi:hypothetical protein
MQFIKKNYEKILLGLVLVGLVVAVAFLPFLVASEKQAQEERSNKIINIKPKPLEPLDLGRYDNLLKKSAAPLVLDFSSTNKLFNPVRWLKGPNGFIKVLPGSELEKLEIVKLTPLHLIISLDSVTPSELGTRYSITVEQQALSRPGQKRRTIYASKGDKKDAFTLRDVIGQPDNPALILELPETPDTPVSVTKDKPFKRVDGYLADLRYGPENKSFPNRRVGDRIKIAGEDYNIVAITLNEVVLSAPNGKKYTRPYNAAP